jgi:hemerythrin-like domain-containing protein
LSLTGGNFAKPPLAQITEMLRDKNLIPLSHQHQHALALCVLINRALERGEQNPAEWQDEIQRLFESELVYHFDAEEQFLFPAAEQIANLAALVAELRQQHEQMRRYALSPKNGDLRELQEFAATLEAHVRREERELFEAVQQSLTQAQLESIGTRTVAYFRESNVPME